MIPWILVWFRLSLAPFFPIGYWLAADGRLYAGLLLAGIVSDIFDGVLARRWKSSTPALRRFDGNVDTIFYGFAGLTAVALHAAYLVPWIAALAAMFLFMIAQNVVNGFKYGRQPSYHMWSGKLWSIALVTALTGLFLGHPSAWALGAMVALSIYNSTEDIIASLVLPKPLTDIPTVFHALKLAREIRRESPMAVE
jgi:CDP-diacylglycerol--glycerol-3-phosphate 3-phosphatidyltransferase